MRRSGAGYGSGRNSTPYTTVKIAVVAPMASARVNTATIVAVAFLISTRPAWRRSSSKEVMRGQTERCVEKLPKNDLLLVFIAYIPDAPSRSRRFEPVPASSIDSARRIADRIATLTTTIGLGCY